MADPTDTDDDETAVLEAPQDEPSTVDEPEGDAPAIDEDEPEEVSITFGDEATPDDDEIPEEELTPKGRAAWAKLRIERTAARREARELKQRLEAQQTQAAPAPVSLGAKPTLEGADFDGEKFAEQLEAWHEQRQKVESEQRKRQEQQQQAESAWRERLGTYGKAKAELKVPDFDAAELAVQETFSLTQQGVMLKGCTNPAQMVYALGKNPKKAKELSALTDPVDFAFAIAKLETQLKVTPRATAPLPEKAIRGTAPGSAQSSRTLDALKETARRTGDYSAYMAAKRKAEGR